MKAKQEYIDALGRMAKEYYSTVRSPEEANKFNNYSRLFKGLVDEHFEEKKETNFEHYKDEIIEVYIEDLAISKGRMTQCCGILCSECGFADKNGDCIGHRRIIEWLKKPYQKQTYKLTQFEYDLLQHFSVDFKFKEMGLLKEMKEKGHFKNINGDELIKDILESCEVIK